MRIRLTAALAFVVIKAALATTIVVAIASNRIILGADSLYTYEDDKSRHGLVCKIESEHGIAVASTGVIFIQDEVLNSLQKRTLDTIQITKRALHGATDVIDAADKFVPLFREPLLAILEAEKVKSPDTYRSRGTRSLLTTVFAGFHDGKPMVVVQNFFLSPPKISYNRTFLTDKPGNNFMAYGEADAIQQQLKVPGWTTTNPIELVTKSLNLEIERDPQFVGGPLSIIELWEKEYRWIEGGLCADKVRQEFLKP